MLQALIEFPGSKSIGYIPEILRVKSMGCFRFTSNIEIRFERRKYFGPDEK